MNRRTVNCLLAASLAWALVISPGAMASEEKPFAEAHVVLQLSDGDAELQSQVLSVANNLIKHYGGPDMVDIEIVAFGPGIALLYPGNPLGERISSLVANGVRFVGCMNTVETLARTTGVRPELIDSTVPVRTGVAHIIQRAGEGYAVIRP